MSAETAAAHFHCKQMTLKVVMCHASGEERKTEEGRMAGKDAGGLGDTPKKRLIVYAEECCEHNPSGLGASLFHVGSHSQLVPRHLETLRARAGKRSGL